MKSIGLTTRQKYAILVFVGIIVAIAVFFLFLKPSMKAVERLYQAFMAKKEDVVQILETGSNQQALSKQISVLTEKIELLNQAYIYPDEEIEFIQFLEDTARKQKVEQNISLSNIASLNEMNLTLNLKANFVDFLSYLNILETSDYYINILSFKINATTDSRRSRNNVVVDDSVESEESEITNNLTMLDINVFARVFLKD